MFGTVAASVLAPVVAGAASSVASSGMLAADDGRLATLGRLFLIAVLVLIPCGIWLHRRDRRRRSPSEPVHSPGDHDLDDVGSSDAGSVALTSVDPGDLRLHLNRIEEFARNSTPDDPSGSDDQLVLEIIDGCRLDGTPVATAIALALVTDTSRQCGLVISRAIGGADDGGDDRAASPASQTFVLTRSPR